MLFVLRPEVVQHCNGAFGAELDALQNLLLAVRSGFHAVSGPFEIFAALSKNENLSERERAVAKRLANRRSELPLLEQMVKHKVYVTGQQQPLKRVNDFVWEIGVSNIKASWLSIPTVLAENAVDAELYEIAAQHYRIVEKIFGVSRCITRGGGGSQVDVELAQLLKFGVPVLAITDGDVAYPNAKKSVISSRCDAFVTAGQSIGWHIALPVREIENILPEYVLSEVADPALRPAARDSFNQLTELAREGHSPSDFTCLKHGKKLSEVFACTDTDERAYWLGLTTTLQKKYAKFHIDCMNKQLCTQHPCICTINSGFGGGVLAQVKRWLLSRSLHEGVKAFCESAQWMRMGEVVFETSIAFPPQST